MNVALAWLSNLILGIFSAWFTAKKSEETGVQTERAQRSQDDLNTVVKRVEQKQKVDDEVDRLTSDARREQLRKWSRRTKPPDHSGG